MNEAGTESVALTHCDREPIHVPGAIQPHGVLIALNEADLIVTQVSGNLPAYLQKPVTEVLGQSITGLLDEASQSVVRRAIELQRRDEAHPLALTVAATRFIGIVHPVENAWILELEPATEEAAFYIRNDASLLHSLAQFQSADSLPPLLDTVVNEVRRLTGFQRVMIYRFDEQGHGTVEAEARDETLDPYLGLRYPASDIPRQARELYLRNWIRFIPDASYRPSPLVPLLRPDTGEPLDLSLAMLRSVSPIHLEYLANMGVRASMSVSLIVSGRLWGLISCAHHEGPHHLSHRIRADCETIGRLTSLKLSALEDAEVSRRRSARQDTLRALAEAMRAGTNVLEALLSRPEALLSLLGATGSAVLHDDRVVCIGSTPRNDAIIALADWLQVHDEASIFSTACLAKHLPEMAESKDAASGVLSFALPGAVRRRIIWFRPEILKSVSWGGDPRKPVEEADGLRLHPRRSFALWKEEVRLCAEPWSFGNLEAVDDLRRYAVEIDLAKQVQREREAVRARDDLVAVVSHDLRNPLGVIQIQVALMRRTIGQNEEERAVRQRASIDRIERSVERMNVLVHDLLDLAKIEAGRFELQRGPESVQEMVEDAMVIMRPLAENKGLSLVEDVPEQTLFVDADRERVFQVLSNLLGNAIKFTPSDGRITVHVQREGERVLFTVNDTGPGITPEQLPNLFNRYWRAPRKGREGSGLGLYIAKGIVEAHGGNVWVEPFHQGGSSFKFTLLAA